MNFQENKKYRLTKNLILLIIAVTLNFPGFFFTKIHAQILNPQSDGSNGNGYQVAGDAPASQQTYNCESLNHPDKLVGKILTIAEERIGKGSSNESYTIINCYRETTCEDVNGESQCTPLYTKLCSAVKTRDANGKLIKEILCQPIQAYLTDSGVSLLYAYVGNIYRWSAGVIGIVTVFYMVLGGIMVAASNGDSAKLEKAKERIMHSIAGLVLLFLSALLLYSINPNFFTK